MNYKELDTKAFDISKKYKYYESSLFEVIMQINETKAFYKLGYNSLFSYIRERLKLSPAITYNFISVARKSTEVPELKKEVLAGNISVSKAQKMTSILNKENQNHWINLAKTETHRKLEREVALASPKTAIREKTSYIASSKEVKEKVSVLTKVPRIQLQLGVSEKIMLKLRRAQDLESQKNKKNINLEDTLNSLLETYLNKYDSIRKAKRLKMKGKLNQINKTKEVNKTPNSSQRRVLKTSYSMNRAKDKSFRKAIPAKVIHQIQLRDQGQCSYIDKKGIRCRSKRFLEIHHLLPVAKEGGNSLENLKLLCSGHHKVCHSLK